MVEPVAAYIEKGLIIDREKFHDGIVSEINDYIEKLNFFKKENDVLRK